MFGSSVRSRAHPQAAGLARHTTTGGTIRRFAPLVRRGRKMRTRIIMLLVICAGVVSAELVRLSLEDAVRQSQIVAVAVLTDIQRKETNQIAECRGTLTIQEVLKGPTTNSVIIFWDFGLPGNEEEDQVDHSPRKGKEFIWLLVRRPDGMYDARHPMRIRDVARKEEIKNLIEKGPNK